MKSVFDLTLTDILYDLSLSKPASLDRGPQFNFIYEFLFVQIGSGKKIHHTIIYMKNAEKNPVIRDPNKKKIYSVNLQIISNRQIITNVKYNTIYQRAMLK